MTQKEEFERYDRKGDLVSKVPLEPDELNPEKYEGRHLRDVHIPNEPINQQSLKLFLLELKPILRDIHSLNHKDRVYLVAQFHRINKSLKYSGLPKDIVDLFEKTVHHFDVLMHHFTTAHHSEVLFALQKTLNHL